MIGSGWSSTKTTMKVLVAAISIALAGNSSAKGAGPSPEIPLSESYQSGTYSPYAERTHPRRPLWGDTHVHTSNSTDAGLAGNRLPPEIAYRFARGEEVEGSSGIPAKPSRPLDWLVVADHSDGMGAIYDILSGDPEVMKFEQVQRWNEGLVAGGKAAADAKVDMVKTFSAGEVDPGIMALYSPGAPKFKSLWEKYVSEAEAFNEPGRFGTLIGFEWTSVVNGNNMHRVVILRDGAERALQVEPLTMTPPAGSPDPRDLWEYMEGYQQNTGGKILAIPHNGNLSNGDMFPLEVRWNGTKLDQAYAEQRARMEPLYEVTQIKGDSEAHPFLSPDDEFADFETWDHANLAGNELKADPMLAGEYAREAFKRGLVLEQRLGTNPYKFGLIGSTDSHTSLATIEENNFFGKNSVDEPHPKRGDVQLKSFGEQGASDDKLMNWQTAASGVTAVWATENSREAIFDAMQRKEVYATTGTRITLRVFGGWDFNDEDLDSRPIENVGYAKGVPMGGNLRPMPSDAKAPRFMIAALRDPDGANLDRVQVVKGWLDGEGNTLEKIFNVAWSGERKPGRDGKLPPVGSTVNVGAATWSNRIGAAELSTVWMDPEFDPKQKAVYYVRVLEIPTPRWTTYDAYRFGVDVAKGAPLAIQERAYSSPIWYQAN
ncbi:MAG: hypothetical protein CL910_05885 [Deltaproteobacteria bacterium]|nr:hypothetical protein [Deltaproteobacteria bacterium]